MARNEIKINLIREAAADGIKKKNLFVNQAFQRAEEEFLVFKQEMLEDFDNHPVTIEIKNGADSDNETGTLGGEEGNLFAFIGFEAGTDPTKELRQVLDENTIIRKTSQSARYKKDEIVYRFPVFSASIDGELAAASPTPFNSSKSWIQMIEGRGFSDINYFLNKFLYDPSKEFPTSRSGPGIQVKPDLRVSSFRPVKYLSEIIQKFNRKFER